MAFKTLLAGAALLAASGDALAKKSYESKASCSIRSISHASSQSKNVAAVAVREVNSALCYDGPNPHDYAHGAAMASAKIFAKAMVDTSVHCTASGNAEYKINGRSYAYAQATGIAKAFALAQANSKTCGKCSAAGKIIVKSFEEIFLSATAELDPYFYGKTSGEDPEVSDEYSLMSKAYEEATVEAFAKVIVDAKSADEECSGNVFAIAGAGEHGNLNVVGCSIDLKAYTDEHIIDSLAKATAEAGATTCLGAAASTSYDIEATAIAEAMAIAVTDYSATCFTGGEDVQGKVHGCAMGEADITKTATAVATAFSKGYAQATSKCFFECDVDYSAMAKAIGHVLATSYSDIYFNHCTDKDFFLKEHSKTVVVKAAAPAIAKIITKAASVFGKCKVIVKPTVVIGPTTTEKYVDPDYTVPTHPVTVPTHPVKKPVAPKTAAPKHRGHPKRRNNKRRSQLKRRNNKRRNNIKRRIPNRGGKGWKKGGPRGGRKGPQRGKKVVKKIVKKISNRTKGFRGSAFFNGKSVSKRISRKN